jgi:hypothetical protein
VSAPPNAPDPSPPARKKKKRRRKPRSESAAGPPFAADYPRTPEVERMVAAFEAGDFAAVRRAAAALRDAADPEVRRAALDLYRRSGSDAASLYLLLLGLGLALFVFWHHLGGR